MRRSPVGLLLALTVLPSACATYHPEPLPQKVDLLLEVPRVSVPTDSLRVPGLAPHPFNGSGELDITETATLAVLNNPDLKARRARAGIAQAQLFAAGLLPDPQLSVDLVHPITGIEAVNGFTAGLSQQINALITRGAEQAAEAAALRQTDLETLWAEWQVAQKARQLFIQRCAQERLLETFMTARTLFTDRYARAKQAMAANQVTLSTAAGDLVTLLDADTQVRELERNSNAARHQLNALLGLAPSAELQLRGGLVGPPPDRPDVVAALANLAERRPDLRALEAGYESGDQRFRQAILAQFPALQVGVARGRETDKTNTVGIGITLSLPFFNGNRGNIAIQQATRTQLRQEYQARLDAAYGEVDQLWQEMTLLDQQLESLRTRLPDLESVTDRARRAFDAGNLDAATYVALESSLLAKHSEAIRLEQALQEARIGLETLLGRSFD
jgi:outer membrane protein TolC